MEIPLLNTDWFVEKFLQMVHDNFSSIERKDNLSFHWKDCFQGREASEINQQDASQSKIEPFCQHHLKCRFACLDDFSQRFPNIF